MKLSDLKSQNEIDTDTFNSLSPLHKDVVNDFFKNLDKDQYSNPKTLLILLYIVFILKLNYV